MEVEFQSKTRIVQYTINGKVEEQALKELLQIQKELPRNPKPKILALVPSFSGFDSFKAMRLAIQVDLGWIGKANKYALVSDIQGLKIFIGALGVLIPSMQVKVYALEDLLEAEKWLGED